MISNIYIYIYNHEANFCMNGDDDDDHDDDDDKRITIFNHVRII